MKERKRWYVDDASFLSVFVIVFKNDIDVSIFFSPLRNWGMFLMLCRTILVRVRRFVCDVCVLVLVVLMDH